VSDDPVPVPVENRPCFKVRFQDAEAIFYLVAIFTDIQNGLYIVIQVCSYGIEPIVLLFLVYNRLINCIVVGSLFATFTGRSTLNESCNIVGPFFNIIYVLRSKDFICLLNLGISNRPRSTAPPASMTL